MSTVEPLYGTSNQTITITLASLANSTVGVGRASTVIDNTSTLAEDALLSLTLVSASSGVSATGYVGIYLYGTADGGSNYTESATGSDAGITLTQPSNALLIATVNVVAVSKTYKVGPFAICKSTGLYMLPQKWGIILVNSSGAALAASGHSAYYQTVNAQIL